MHNLKEKISFIGNIKIDLKFSTPTTVTELEEVERHLDFQFPKELRNIYVTEASSVELRWRAHETIFGASCKTGEFHLSSPFSVLEFYTDMIDIVQDFQESAVFEGEEWLEEISDDFKHWIPIIRFSNGDAFCIDKRNLHIVFLEHDVMDEGPNLHGMKIAKCFEDLIINWSKLGFVDIYDWSVVCDENGIDVNNKQFETIKEIISKSI